MKNITIIIIACLSLILMGISGCQPIQQLDNITNQTSIITGPQPNPGEVIIKDFQFYPSELTISKGDKVIFINKDSMDHTVTSDMATYYFDFKIKPGLQVIQYFNIPGIYNYHCSIHPSMQGKIIVK